MKCICLLLFLSIFLTTTLLAQQNCIQANAGSDKTVCGQSITIGTPATSGFSYAWSPLSGLNNPFIAQPTATVGTSTTYTLTVTPPNLLSNGDFESWNTGFSTDYGAFPAGDGSCGGGNVGFGSVTVGTNPVTMRSYWCNKQNHTPNGSQMLIVDGSCFANRRVWYQTVSVTQNTTYNFSGWASTNWWGFDDPVMAGHLRVRINGVDVIQNFIVFWSSSLPCDNWLQFATSWSSGTATSAIIEIFNDNQLTYGAGNDFSIDDLLFSTCQTTQDQVNVSVVCGNPCSGSDIYNSGVLPASPSKALTIYIGSSSGSGSTGLVTTSSTALTSVVAGLAIIILPDFKTSVGASNFFNARIEPCSSQRNIPDSPEAGKIIIHHSTVDINSFLDSFGINMPKAYGNQLELFPNPATSILQLRIKNPLSSHYIKVFNANGALVLEKQILFSSLTGQLDISNLPKGVYFLYFRQKALSQIKRFVKL